MIPKVLHYCWFGGNPKSDLILHCMESWHKYLPEYEFIEWNESTFPTESHRFTNENYLAKRYAFVTDYVRAFALYTQGGVYLDTDVELKSSLNPFLEHSAFSGFERSGLPFTAVWGSERSHIWPKKVMEMYDNFHNDNFLPTNTSMVSNLLTSEFGIDPIRNEFQLGTDGIAIYPSSHFCLDIPPTFATHHFGGSWLREEDRNTYKYWLNREWRSQDLVNHLAEDDLDSALGHLFRRIGLTKVIKSLFRIALKVIIAGPEKKKEFFS
jgi:hypothetical protein